VSNYSLRPSVTELTRFNSPKRPGDSCTTRASRRACTFLSGRHTRRRRVDARGEPGRRRNVSQSARLAHALARGARGQPGPTGVPPECSVERSCPDAKFALSGDDVVERLALLISVSGTNLRVRAQRSRRRTGARRHMVRVKTFVDDDEFLTYSADGVMVATPTGSTGYNFSAAGRSSKRRCRDDFDAGGAALHD